MTTTLRRPWDDRRVGPLSAVPSWRHACIRRIMATRDGGGGQNWGGGRGVGLGGVVWELGLFMVEVGVGWGKKGKIVRSVLLLTIKSLILLIIIIFICGFLVRSKIWHFNHNYHVYMRKLNFHSKGNNVWTRHKRIVVVFLYSLGSIVLRGCRSFTEVGLRHLVAGCRQLRSFDVSYTGVVTDQVLADIATHLDLLEVLLIYEPDHPSSYMETAGFKKVLNRPMLKTIGWSVNVYTFV